MILNEYSFIERGIAISTKGRSPEKYERILEAAVKVFAEQGYFKATVSQIAREAGVADGTIYLYFKNKDDILVQFLNFKAKQVFDILKREVGKTRNPQDKLRILIHRHLDEFQRDRNMAVLFQALTHQPITIVEKEIKEISKIYLDILSDILEQGQHEGSFRIDLYMSLVKRFILGAVDAVITSWLHSGDKYDLISMADPLVDLFFRGIGSTNNKLTVL